MRGKEIRFGTEARESLFRGIDKLEKSVITTLGPKGRNVLIYKEGSSHPVITKDGVSVARSINFSDNYENAGATVIKEAAEKTNTIAGDGPQPLWAKILTPNGFTEMGKIQKGDVICGTEGTTQEVIEVFDKGLKHLYRVKFNDGSIVECSGDHIWTVIEKETEDYGFSGKRSMYSSNTLPLSEIIKDFDKKSFYVSRSYAKFYKKSVSIDPFILGLIYKNDNVFHNKMNGITKIILPIDKIDKYFSIFLSTVGAGLELNYYERLKQNNRLGNPTIDDKIFVIVDIFKHFFKFEPINYDYDYDKEYNYDNVQVSAEKLGESIIINISGKVQFENKRFEKLYCDIYDIFRKFNTDEYINRVIFNSSTCRKRLLLGILYSSKECKMLKRKKSSYTDPFSIENLCQDKTDVIINICKSLGCVVSFDTKNHIYSSIPDDLGVRFVNVRNDKNQISYEEEVTESIYKIFKTPADAKSVPSRYKESFNKIISIEDMDKDVPMRCIKVSNPDHLYFTNDYVLTHNTTTTVLFASELIRAGLKLINNGSDPIEVQKGFDAACADVLKIIDEKKKALSGEKDIKSIATISANNDEDVGEIVKEAFCGIGEGGIVNIGDSHSKSGKTEVKFSDGLEFFRGLKSSVYMNDMRNEAFDVTNPLVIILDCFVESKDMTSILNFAVRTKQPLVLIVSDIDEMLENQMYQRAKGKMGLCAIIQAPGNTPYEVSERLKDIAVMLNTKVIESVEDLKDFNSNVDFFGTCDRLIAKINKTTIEGSKATEEQIQARVDELNKQIIDGKNDTERGISEEEIKSIKSRIAALTGGIATIQIGGFSEVRIKELKDRYEDSVRAVESAIAEGILPGGGVALCKSAYQLRNSEKFINMVSGDFKSAYLKFLEVCKIPITTIISSVSSDYAYIIADIEHNDNFNYGYNAKKQVVSNDMIVDGVTDPALVTKTALRYSTDVAGVFITTECVVSPERNDNISVEPNDPIVERQPQF